MYGIEFHADGNGLNPFRTDVIDAELAKRFPAGARPERADPALRGGITEHRRSGFRPRCRAHLAGRRQATLSARH